MNEGRRVFMFRAGVRQADGSPKPKQHQTHDSPRRNTPPSTNSSIHPSIKAVVSDVPTCGGVQYAASHGIATLTYPAPKKGGFPGLTTEQLVQQLTQTLGAEYVLLAGFLKVRSGAAVMMLDWRGGAWDAACPALLASKSWDPCARAAEQQAQKSDLSTWF